VDSEGIERDVGDFAGAAITAFFLVALIALTLPAGALLARYWHASWTVVGLLSAFGAGALIAGVAVDLVAESIEHDTFAILAAGAVVGGLLFTVLNRLVNARGGFLRKASTTITYLKDRELRARRRELSHLGRVPWFDELPPSELDIIIDLLEERDYDTDAHVHRIGDRTEHLSIVASGSIRLEDDDDPRTVVRNEAFGTRAFLTGAPHTTTAMAAEPTTLYRLSRRGLFDQLHRLPVLRARLRAALDEPEMRDYLTRRHGLERAEVHAWMDSIQHGEDPSLRAADVERPDLPRLLELLRGQPWAADLGEDELAAFADRMFVVRSDDGDVLYRPGDRGDREYFVEAGEVLVVHPDRPWHATRSRQGDAFGARSFATGLRRAGTAISVGPSRLWVIRRRDLDHLLHEYPHLRQAWAAQVHAASTRSYVERAHGYDPETADRVIEAAYDSVKHGRVPPELRRLAITSAAAIAIWLGLLLDGIPEALAIGSSIERGIAVALVAGMMISNVPEALASSRGMAEQGMPWSRIYQMWGGQVIAAGLAGAIGAVAFARASEGTFAFIDGIAAGAIITVAAETMLPEAYERSGALTGLAALFGFLAAAAIGVVLS
jgi:CRP-like cAMP-binding protein